MTLDSIPAAAAALSDPALHVYLQGVVPFDAALAFQRRQVYQLAGEPALATLLLCEHPPLITVGREGSRAHILYEPDELRARQWRIRWVNRGGGCTLHLPGQLAIYPMLSLSSFQLGLQEYLDRLSQVLVAVLDDFGVAADLRPGRAGVWVGDRPIAAVGVAVRDWVAYYGAVLNVCPPLEPFKRIRSRFAADGPMTSLARERRGLLPMSMVRERVIEHFAAGFRLARTTLFFEHPALTREAPSDALATSP
jgi:lipoyl(octanoyl) transferase